jgi:hypothetical protein
MPAPPARDLIDPCTFGRTHTRVVNDAFGDELLDLVRSLQPVNLRIEWQESLNITWRNLLAGYNSSGHRSPDRLHDCGCYGGVGFLTMRLCQIILNLRQIFPNITTIPLPLPSRITHDNVLYQP